MIKIQKTKIKEQKNGRYKEVRLLIKTFQKKNKVNVAKDLEKVKVKKSSLKRMTFMKKQQKVRVKKQHKIQKYVFKTQHLCKKTII